MAKIPPGFHTLTPSICVSDGDKAIALYKKAFGAEELHRMLVPGTKKIMHAALQIGTSKLMLNDEFGGMKAPKNGKGGSSFYVYVEKVDAAHRKAVAAGMTETMAPADMFWGDRMSNVVDPFGHSWSLATHIREMSMEEMEAGMKAMLASAPKPKKRKAA